MIAFAKGYSKDEWTSTIVRAAREVCAALSASPFVEWERRRTSQGAIIADNLTHNILEELSEEEVRSYLRLGRVTFPRPILSWMASPGADRCLGTKVIKWMNYEHPALKVLIN